MLLGLIDLCLEHAGKAGEAPTSLTTRQLAEKVVALYWPHSLPFAADNRAVVLRQNTSGQAEILTLIRHFHEAESRFPLATLSQAPSLAVCHAQTTFRWRNPEARWNRWLVIGKENHPIGVRPVMPR